MSVTEQIIEVVERGHALGLSDAKIEEMLLATGCSRIVYRTDLFIAFYKDQNGQERFLMCTNNPRQGRN